MMKNLGNNCNGEGSGVVSTLLERSGNFLKKILINSQGGVV